MRTFDYVNLVKPGKRAKKMRLNETAPSTARCSHSQRRPGPDPLGEARQAANTILASWALRAIVARRALGDT